MTKFDTVKFKSQPGDIKQEAIAKKFTEVQWIYTIVDSLESSLHGIHVHDVKVDRRVTKWAVVRWIEFDVGYYCRLDTMIDYLEEALPPAIHIYGIERRGAWDWGYLVSLEISAEIIAGGAKL